MPKAPTRAKVRPKELYAETYHSHTLKIRQECLPSVPSAAPGFTVHSAYIQKAGRVLIEGETLEFQDLRVYFNEPKT